MKILAIAGDHGGCGFYRIRLPATHCESEVQVDTQLWVGRDRQGQIIDVDPFGADVVVLQRPTTPLHIDVMALLQDRGIAVVVETDDDFTTIHPANPARCENSRVLLMQAAQKADLVTVSTPALARRYAPHGRVAVLPNVIPKSYLDIETDRQETLVGWSGTVRTHPEDLQVTGGTMNRVGAPFHVIGPAEGVKQALRLDTEPTSTGWVGLGDYPYRLAELTVGIVPLADSMFNHAKSALKMLEMAALGVAPVGSPTPDNRRVHNLGIGLVAKRPHDWLRQVRSLVTDQTLRDEIADRSRNAASLLTIEANAWRWDEAWARARINANLRRTRVPQSRPSDLFTRPAPVPAHLH